MELMNGLPIQEVRMEEHIAYHCNCCGDCCRNIENAVMLDGYDLYRLAKHFQTTVMQAINRYATPMSLDETGYPIFVLNTIGSNASCIFLKGNRCSVQRAKPRTCRLYPFTAGPGDDDAQLRYYLCLEKTRHFDGGQIQVGNWLKACFSDDDRQFLASEYLYIPEIGACYRMLIEERRTMARTQMLFFRYLNFNPKRPFMPQYDNNNAELLHSLSKLVRQERGLDL